MSRNFDVIVVGSGIAGLSFALQVASAGRSVAILTKKNRAASNTNYAQGGIACVTAQNDDFQSHLEDTLESGDGLCDAGSVEEIIREGPARVKELIDIGVHFSQLEDGSPSLGREGGHSHRRVLHVKDITGKAIESALLRATARNNFITVREHFFAIDLIRQKKLTKSGFAVRDEGDSVIGLYALDVLKGRVEVFRAPVVMLTTGGLGQVYQFTTNPDIATGDGIAMAYRAGVKVANMEFVQFHPTSLYSATGDRFLISEAVRGEGAILRNADRQPFMKDHHARADLAPRDIVARAIDREMKQSGAQHLWLDITGHPEEVLQGRFPNIFEVCARKGINMATDLIPVVPAAHYLCGGVRTNLSSETSLPGLYACGEVACTGLHGANRLASNSLLEAVVMARRGSLAVVEYFKEHEQETVALPEWVDGDAEDSDERVVLSHNWDELRRTMWDYVGIVRTTKRLERARARIQNLKNEIYDYYWNFKVEPRLLELRNMTEVADLIVQCALQRKESRGLHYTLDYPKKLPEAKNTTVMKREL